MSDAEFARIVRMALLSIVRALEKKYPEIAPRPDASAVCRPASGARPRLAANAAALPPTTREECECNSSIVG
jgi:hypothetical protein